MSFQEINDKGKKGKEMARKFLIAAIQLNSTNQLKKNLERARYWIGEAVERGAELILLPEDFAYLAESEEEKIHLSQKELDSIPEAIREESIRHNVYILAGGYPTREEGERRVFNTATLFSPQGEELASYRKIHLFDAHPPGALPLKESEFTAPGSEPVIVDTPLCKIGLSICYDLRFPELYRYLALRGAELLAVTAAFTLTTGKDHWLPLLRARAIENQCYVAAANQWGRHSSKRHSFGSSSICDPWGTILATAPEGEGMAIAEFNPERLNHVRQIVPSIRHVNPQLLSSLPPKEQSS